MKEASRIGLLEMCDRLFEKHMLGFQERDNYTSDRMHEKTAHLDMAVKWATIATHLRLMGPQQ